MLCCPCTMQSIHDNGTGHCCAAAPAWAQALSTKSIYNKRRVPTVLDLFVMQLKPGMRDIAAFLESRRMASYVGATSEFSKWEVSFPSSCITALQNLVHHMRQSAASMTTYSAAP